MLGYFNGNKKVLLIEPPFYSLFGYKRYHYPMTLTLLGTYLEELGHEVSILDLDFPDPEFSEYSRSEARNAYYQYIEALNNKEHAVWRRVEQVLEEYQPEVLGLTSITPKIDSANIIAKMAKRMFGNNIKVQLGGAHVKGMRTLDPVYDFGGCYDSVVDHIPALINRKPNKKLLMQYDEYPINDFFSVMTLMGCPNSCTFCCNSFEKKIVYRDVDTIQEELVELSEINKKHNANYPVYIVDDCFFSSTKRFDQIAGTIHELGMNFKAGSRIMALSESKIDDFIQYGGIKLFIGVESGSQRVLDRIKKKIKVSEIIKRTRMLNEKGIDWSAFFIVGFPFETIEDLKKTRELIEIIQPSFVSLNRFTPYPGTEIYQEFYVDSRLEFSQLFQLNKDNGVKLNNEIEEYIEDLFLFADKYNAGKAAQGKR
ncbi:MAG: B12-binding domain-containing radical SAM protein [Deltaproteobacteria bacterium]